MIAKEALKALMPQDYCGLIHWDGTPRWLWGNGLLDVGRNREQMLARIDRMTPGDMPDFKPADVAGLLGLSKACPTRPSST